MQSGLCFQGRFERIARRGKGRVKRVADNFEDPASIAGGCLLQDGIVAREELGKRLGKLLRKRRAALCP